MLPDDAAAVIAQMTAITTSGIHPASASRIESAQVFIVYPF